ncbi:DNA-binding protein [Vibrio cholerae]|nr:DNA-binding protein [Vibrio cholerae]
MKSHFTNYDHPFFHISKEDRIKNGRKGANVSGNRPYSKDEDDYLIKNYQKIPFTEMAKIFGRSSHSVYTRSKKLIRDGLIANNGSWRKSHYSKQEDQFIIESQDKLSFAEVGAILGRSRDSVKVRAGKLGVSYQKIAETSPVHKLTNEDVEFMRELADSGLNYCEITRKFEVDNSHARRVCIFESRLYQDKYDFLGHMTRQSDAVDGQD